MLPWPRRACAALVIAVLLGANPAVPCLLQCLAHARAQTGHHDHGSEQACAGGTVTVGHEIPGTALVAVVVLAEVPGAVPAVAIRLGATPARTLHSISLVPEPPPPRV